MERSNRIIKDGVRVYSPNNKPTVADLGINTVKTITPAPSVTLTTDEYQYLYGNMNMTLTLPDITTNTDITELHLFYLPNAVRTLTFSSSDIKWQNSVPNIEADKWYEFIFIRTHTLVYG